MKKSSLKTAVNDAVIHLAINKDTHIKQKRFPTLNDVFEKHQLRPFVYSTTQRTVGSVHGFGMPMITTPAVNFFHKGGFYSNFEEVKEKIEFNIELVKAKIAYEKLNEFKGFRPASIKELNS